MKKFVSATVAMILIIVVTIPAFAGGHGRVTNSSRKYSVCSAESCVKLINHTHSGTKYLAHYYGDGHDYHEYCDNPDCVLTGYHEHDGVYCFGHTAGDGHRHKTHKSNGRHH